MSVIAEPKLCECGCGNPVNVRPYHRIPRFIHGHHRNQPRAEKNFQWRGDEVGYDALHDWVNRYKERTGICEECGHCPVRKDGKVGTHFANISGEYLRDVDDYVELCPSCHKRMDLE